MAACAAERYWVCGGGFVRSGGGGRGFGGGVFEPGGASVHLGGVRGGFVGECRGGVEGFHSAEDGLRGFAGELLVADGFHECLECALRAVGLQAARADFRDDAPKDGVGLGKVRDGFAVHRESERKLREAPGHKRPGVRKLRDALCLRVGVKDEAMPVAVPPAGVGIAGG